MVRGTTDTVDCIAHPICARYINGSLTLSLEGKTAPCAQRLPTEPKYTLRYSGNDQPRGVVPVACSSNGADRTVIEGFIHCVNKPRRGYGGRKGQQGCLIF